MRLLTLTQIYDVIEQENKRSCEEKIEHKKIGHKKIGQGLECTEHNIDLRNILYLLNCLRINVILDCEFDNGCVSKTTIENISFLQTFFRKEKITILESSIIINNCHSPELLLFDDKHKVIPFFQIGYKSPLTDQLLDICNKLVCFIKCHLSGDYHYDFGKSSTKAVSKISTAIQMIDIVLYQICQDTEKGCVGDLVQSTMFTLIRFLFSNNVFVLYDSNMQIIKNFNRYDDIYYYGIRLFDNCGNPIKVGMIYCATYENGCSYSIGRLAQPTRYVDINLNYLSCVTTDSNALCKLKNFFISVKDKLE